MAIKAKYEQPLQVVETAEMHGRIRAIAEAEEISIAQVVRDLNTHGIEWREQLSRERLDP